MNWQTILTTAHDAPPNDEWWYALPPDLSDDEYTTRIKAAETAFKLRFGYLPDAIPRVVFVGNTPVLAYPCPTQPEPMPIEPVDPGPLQLTLGVLA